MTILVNDVRDAFIDRYPDAQDNGNLRILALIQEADIKIASILPTRHDHFDLPVASGDNDYPFQSFPNGAGGSDPEEIVRIYAVAYIRSPNQGDHKNLTGKDPRWLDKYRGVQWRLPTISAEPGEYAVDAGVNGRIFYLLPTPTITTSSGFPIVRLYASCHKVLAYGDVLAVDLPSKEIYLSHMCWKWAKTNDRNAVAGWASDFQSECRSTERFLYNFIEQENASVLPAFYPTGGVV